MVPELRSSFNAAFTADKYEQFIERLHRRCHAPVQFRVCETPCFFPESLIHELSDAGTAMIRQLVEDPAYRKASDVTIPAEWNVPNENKNPMFIQVDFGLVRDKSGRLKPCLVELQAFPSLYFYQPALAEEYVASYGLDPKLKLFLSGLDKRSY